MIEVYKRINGKISQIKNIEPGSWINISFPNENDLLYLKDFIDIPKEILNSLTDIDEIPTIERLGKNLFILTKTPQKKVSSKKIKRNKFLFNKSNEEELEYFTVPLGILISDKYLITICYYENDIIEILKKEKKFTPSKKIRSTLKILLLSAKTYLKYLKEIHTKIYKIQKVLEKSTKNEEVIKLLNIEKTLVYFRTALNSNYNLIERLTKSNIFTKYEQDKEILDDVIEETKQAIQVTEIYSDILSGMMDAFASIISNNLNLVMKFLTTITIILMIPTLIASFYGMNVKLPFQGSEHAFSYTILMSVGLVLISIIIFWYNEFF